MNETLYLSRSIYREMFNDMCADFSIYRLNNSVDAEFEDKEKGLWKCREKAVRMECEDIKRFDSILKEAREYLINKTGA